MTRMLALTAKGVKSAGEHTITSGFRRAGEQTLPLFREVERDREGGGAHDNVDAMAVVMCVRGVDSERQGES